MMDTDKIKYWLFADRIPLTKILIVTNAVTFIYTMLAHGFGPLGYLVFRTPTIFQEPWTLLTYPIVNGCGGIFCVLFSCYWLWIAGGSLERAWGTNRFAIFFFELAAISALAMYAGSVVIPGVEVLLAGLLLVEAGVTVAFGMLNPEMQILFMFIIPMKLKYLAMISAAAATIGYAAQSPLLGIFALAGCAFSYWYVRTARYSGASHWPEPRGEVIRVHNRESFLSRLNPFKWIRQYRSRKRLRKLFEDSGLGEDDRR